MSAAKMTIAQRNKLTRSMTQPQLDAMTTDDVDGIRSQTWRALVRYGFARTAVEGRNALRVYTPLGRRLRAALREREDELEAQYNALVGEGWAGA